MADNDPRVFFAAERTLLAWVRTALGLIGMGFVVAKFELLRLSLPEMPHHSHFWSVVLGVALAVLGEVSSAVASWRQARFCRTLVGDGLPRRYRVARGVMPGTGVECTG